MEKREWTRVSLVLVALIGLLAASPLTWSQEVTANIVGTVVDPSGAPVANANVTAQDTARGTVYSSKTNETGSYTIQRIPVGTYTVKASAPGSRRRCSRRSPWC